MRKQLLITYLLFFTLNGEIIIDEQRGAIMERCSSAKIYDVHGYFPMAFRIIAPNNIGKPILPNQCGEESLVFQEYKEEHYEPKWYNRYLEEMLGNTSKKIDSKYAPLDSIIDKPEMAEKVGVVGMESATGPPGSGD